MVVVIEKGLEIANIPLEVIIDLFTRLATLFATLYR